MILCQTCNDGHKPELTHPPSSASPLRARPCVHNFVVHPRRELVRKLGMPLFFPINKIMGKSSNKVCIGWTLRVSLSNNLVVNVKASLKVIPLKFGTFWEFVINEMGMVTLLEVFLST